MKEKGVLQNIKKEKNKDNDIDIIKYLCTYLRLIKTQFVWWNSCVIFKYLYTYVRLYFTATKYLIYKI